MLINSAKLLDKLKQTPGEVNKLNDLATIMGSSMAVKFLKEFLLERLPFKDINEAAISGAYAKGYNEAFVHLENFLDMFIVPTQNSTGTKLPPATYGSKDIIKENLFTNKEMLEHMKKETK